MGIDGSPTQEDPSGDDTLDSGNTDDLDQANPDKSTTVQGLTDRLHISRRNTIASIGALSLLGMSSSSVAAQNPGQGQGQNQGQGSGNNRAINWADADTDGLLEPTDDAITGIDVTDVQTDSLAGGVTGTTDLTSVTGNGLSISSGSLGIATGGVGSTELANDTVTVAGNSVSLGGSTGVDHADLTGVDEDQHHAKDHDHSEPDVSSVPISGLTNSSVTVAGNSVTLGGTTGVDYIDLGDTGGSFPIPNDDIENSSVTVSAGDGLQNGGSASLGGSTSLAVEPADFAGRNLTKSGGNLNYVPPENVLVVAQSGGDYTSLGSALGSITDNSATNPYVIKVQPGVYNEQIQLKSYVDIVGAGLNATRLESTQNLVTNATLQLNGASNVEVRNLTVQGKQAAVSSATAGSDVILSRSRLQQTGTTFSRVLYHTSGTLKLRNCIVRTTEGSSDGISMFGGTVDVLGCQLEANDDAIFLSDVDGPTVTVRRSFLDGSTAISNQDSGATARAAHSQLNGGVDGSLDSKFSVHDNYTGI